MLHINSIFPINWDAVTSNETIEKIAFTNFAAMLVVTLNKNFSSKEDDQ